MFTIVDYVDNHCQKAAYIWANLGFILLIIGNMFVKSLYSLGVPASQIQYFRALISLALNYPFIIKNKEKVYKIPKIQNPIQYKMLCQMYFPFANFYGITQMVFSDAIVLTQTTPIWVLIWSRILFKDTISFKQYIYTFISFLGIILIVRPSFLFHEEILQQNNSSSSIQQNKIIGSLAILSAGIIQGLNQALNILIQRHKTEDNNVSNLIMVHYYNIASLLVTGPVFFIINGYDSYNSFNQGYNACSMQIIMGVFCYLGHLLWTKATLMEKPSKLSPLQYTKIVYSYMIDIIVFKEELNIFSIIGAVIVVVCCYQIIYLKNQQKKSLQQQQNQLK